MFVLNKIFYIYTDPRKIEKLNQIHNHIFENTYRYIDCSCNGYFILKVRYFWLAFLLCRHVDVGIVYKLLWSKQSEKYIFFGRAAPSDYRTSETFAIAFLIQQNNLFKDIETTLGINIYCCFINLGSVPTFSLGRWYFKFLDTGTYLPTN